MRRLVLLFAAFVLAYAALAEARSGCCSHHGGVCDCRCCDGTALSTTCAPYYPTCSGGGGGNDPGPTAPASLAATPLSSTEVNLSWQDTSTGETAFRIQAHENPAGVYEQVGSVGANVTSARIGNLEPHTSYSFRVFAQGGSSESGPSNEVTVSTLGTPTSACVNPGSCFGGNRFAVAATWRKPTGETGTATVVHITPDSGYLWFFDSSNVETVFKVIDGCGLNGHHWFFAGGLTNVKVVLTVTDSLTGEMKTYTNPQNTAFQPIQDTSALGGC